MKIQLLFIVFIAISCGQLNSNSQKVTNSSDTVKKVEKALNSEINVAQNDTTKKIDLQEFWDNAVVPILKVEKNKVITNIEFPVFGQWAEQIGLEKKSIEITINDFTSIYDSVFNKDFLKDLSNKTYKDATIYKENDTTWYSFSVGKQMGQTEGGLWISFYNKNGKFKLRKIQGVGANFYYKGDY